MYKKKHINKNIIMMMSPNACLAMIQEQQMEIERLTRLVEKQGKKCNKYQRMLAAAHFGGEENVPNKKRNLDAGRYTFAGSKNYGYYSYFENGLLVIGYNVPLESSILYRGEYKGEQTPELDNIRKDNVKMYNSIKKFFTNKQ